jgi:hypothetical protein
MFILTGEIDHMFSVRQKRDIAARIQAILRNTNHPELPDGEIEFYLRVEGKSPLSWAFIRNNGQVSSAEATANPHNERQDDHPG